MPEQEFKKRFTAYRVSIGMLLSAEQLFDQDRFRAISFNNKEIVRVNLIATVVDKFTSDLKPYAAITLDDNTGTIRAKVFADDVFMLKDIQIGDTVLIIGLLREFNNELYVIPEIIKTLDPKWLLARKLELGKEFGTLYETLQKVDKLAHNKQEIQDDLTSEFDEKVVPEKIQDESQPTETAEEKTLKHKLLDMIQEAESQGGINIEQVILTLKESPERINKEIQSLLEEGSIFEPKPGVLRIL